MGLIVFNGAERPARKRLPAAPALRRTQRCSGRLAAIRLPLFRSFWTEELTRAFLPLHIRELVATAMQRTNHADRPADQRLHAVFRGGKPHWPAAWPTGTARGGYLPPAQHCRPLVLSGRHSPTICGNLRWRAPVVPPVTHWPPWPASVRFSPIATSSRARRAGNVHRRRRYRGHLRLVDRRRAGRARRSRRSAVAVGAAVSDCHSTVCAIVRPSYRTIPGDEKPFAWIDLLRLLRQRRFANADAGRDSAKSPSPACCSTSRRWRWRPPVTPRRHRPRGDDLFHSDYFASPRSRHVGRTATGCACRWWSLAA